MSRLILSTPATIGHVAELSRSRTHVIQPSTYRPSREDVQKNFEALATLVHQPLVQPHRRLLPRPTPAMLETSSRSPTSSASPA
jgi:hypothetical protein